MSFKTFTFTGTVQELARSPHEGNVQVWANVPEIRDSSGRVAMAGTLTVPLDSNGSWSVELPADDPALSPSSGLGYVARVRTQRGTFPQKRFPAQPAGSALDWAAIATASVPVAAPDVAVTTTTIGSYLDGGSL